MRANSMCLSCMLRKQDKLVRQFDNEEKKAGYLHRVLEELLDHTEAVSEEEYSQYIRDLETAHRGRSSKGFLKRQRKSYWMPI